MNSIKTILLCLSFLLLAASSCRNNNTNDENRSKETAITLQDGVDYYKSGRKLFLTKCSACHGMPHMGIDGPNIFIELFDRLPDHSESYFRKFVMDGKLLRQSGDEYLRQWEESCKCDCAHDFRNKLTDTELEEILVYLKVVNRAKEKGVTI